jgi:hypothetical protein
LRRAAEAFIGSAKLIVRCAHGATFHRGIPVDIGDVGITYDIDISDIGVVDVRVIPISASPPGIERFKGS